jgi:hypothetical protein
MTRVLLWHLQCRQVHALGGCWTVWLLLWWTWCGLACVACSGWPSNGRAAGWVKFVFLMVLTLGLPLLMGSTPFALHAVPVHTAIVARLHV